MTLNPSGLLRSPQPLILLEDVAHELLDRYVLGDVIGEVFNQKLMGLRIHQLDEISFAEWALWSGWHLYAVRLGRKSGTTFTQSTLAEVSYVHNG